MQRAAMAVSRTRGRFPGTAADVEAPAGDLPGAAVDDRIHVAAAVLSDPDRGQGLSGEVCVEQFLAAGAQRLSGKAECTRSMSCAPRSPGSSGRSGASRWRSRSRGNSCGAGSEHARRSVRELVAAGRPAAVVARVAGTNSTSCGKPSTRNLANLRVPGSPCDSFARTGYPSGSSISSACPVARKLLDKPEH